MPISVAAGVLVVLGAVFVLSALSARKDLNIATLHAQALQQAIIGGDKDDAAASLAALQESAHAAHERSDGILWKIATKVPWAGDDVRAVRVVAQALDEVSRSALPPVVDISTQLNLNNFAPRKGKVDLALLATLNGPVAASDASFAAQKARLDTIDLDGLVGAVRTPVENFVSRINSAATATSITNNALELIPTMLGDTDRTYLLVFQNNAEVRATAGLPGSYLVMNVNKGKITRGDQGAGAGIQAFSKNVLKLSKEETKLYGNDLARIFVDSNFTPEFPRTAEIMMAMAKKADLGSIDGVISIDPVTMSYILDGTGPVELDDGTRLTSQNAVKELINNVYFRYPLRDDADDFFEDAAARLFDFVTDGRGDSGKVIRALVRASKERRVYIWSAHDDEQKKLDPTGVAGSIGPDSADQPSLGIFLNDATGTKLEYYLDHGTRVQSVECRDDGSQLIDADISLASKAPANAAAFPSSIVTEQFGASRGTMQMNLQAYLPTGSTIVSARIDDRPISNDPLPHLGHDVLTVPIVLRPGQVTNVEIILQTAPGQSRTMKVSTTPTVRPFTSALIEPTSCTR